MKKLKITKEDILVIVPARYGSSRFPGKPLALLAGKPIILHTLGRVAEAGYTCVAATDDERILRAVADADMNVVMTSFSHRSGTDRIHEAYNKLCLSDNTATRECAENCKVIINVQGDEPFIDPAQIDLLASCFNEEGVDIATLARPFPQLGDVRELQNPNLVKLVKDSNGRGLYFSRSVIPYLRGIEPEDWPKRHQFLTHIGIYAYTPEALQKITKMPQSSLEIAESLEQLRWLENGLTIKVKESHGVNIGIDTPEDLEAAEKFISEQASETKNL